MEKRKQKVVTKKGDDPIVKPSDRVLEAIGTANCSPRDQRPADFSEYKVGIGVYSPLDDVILAAYPNQWLEELGESFPRLYEFLTRKEWENDPGIDYNRLMLRFAEYEYLHKLMHGLADYAEKYRQAHKDDDLPKGPVIPASNFYVDRNTGCLEIDTNLIVHDLVKLDLSRLRRCLNCSDIFWAFRANQLYCSHGCKATYLERARRSDENRRRKINEQRRENYSYAKARKTK